jgi:hypothetical protein
MRHRRLQSTIVCRVAIAFALSVLVAPTCWSFPAPDTTGWTVWQAEEAGQTGSWQLGEPSGDGAQYLSPSQAGDTLTFSFTTDAPMSLRVRPVWWRSGDQRLAHRFPYPLVRQPGPDAVDFVGATVFATAPAAGRVITAEALTEKVTGYVEVGGYLSDLVADRAKGRVYVADALGDRVVALDAARMSVLGSVDVPGGPWALALNGDRLFVACREGKRLAVFSTDTGQQLADIPLPAEPIGLELNGNPATSLIVRYQQQPINAMTFQPAQADQQQYAAPEGWRPPEGCGGPTCKCTWVEIEGPHKLAMVSGKGDREVVDVSAVTGLAPKPEIVSRVGAVPGPASTAMFGIGDPPVVTIFFSAPASGRIGIYDTKSRTFDSIDVGSLSTFVVVDEKLFVVDPLGDRVLVLDPKTRKIEAEFGVPGGPMYLVAVGEVRWQREEYADSREVWPPTPVNRLFVTCAQTKDIAVLDLKTHQLIGRLPVPAEPRGVTFIPMPNPGWWPLLADDRISLALEPRVAVEFRPSQVDLATMVIAPAPLSTPPAAPRRDRAQVTVSGGAAKTFLGANTLALTVDGGRTLDLSALADPMLGPDRPLSQKDTVGAATVSVDGGPEYDWARGTWMAPDSEVFLVNNSEEFWRYNAPILAAGPGQHELRVRAHSPFLRLDGIAVCRTPEPDLDLAILPEPQGVHGRVSLISYHGVFYDAEPARFTVRLTNRAARPTQAKVSYALTDHLDDTTHPVGPAQAMLDAGETTSWPLDLSGIGTGRFRLTVTVDTPSGRMAKEIRFLRMPKLEHPRLFYRREDLPAIQDRIARYPTLFRRYAEWLERMSDREGKFPERFLPPGMTADDCASVAPEGTDPKGARDLCGWRNYEVGWRILASELALALLKPDSEKLKAKVEAFRNAEKVDDYCQFHHHGPFFPGVDGSLIDLAPDPSAAAPKIRKQMEGQWGSMDVLPWTLTLLEEPITPEKRAIIYEIMTMENNAEQHFGAHHGARGGVWWQNPYTWCHCPNHGYTLMFMFLKNVFGEPRLFDKPIFTGYLTFQRYADPFQDIAALQPNRRGPNGEPWHWILASLSRHPLEKATYQWDEWVEKMNGPLPGDEAAAVDKLMALEGVDLKGPMAGAANYFVSAVSVPMALALGWYDPAAPEVDWGALPPTAVFDVEGWATMRSGWDRGATEVTFASGVRDHTARNKPNHLTIVKGGRYLLGTPSLLTDDGYNTGAWANTVVIGDDWRQQWTLNLQHPRDGEHVVINRFSPLTFTYISRDRAAVGYKPAEQGWGGGLDLHGHTETIFMQEGRLLAYQTWPALDYAAGDASNAWPVDKVSKLDRQVVFVKPDLVVVYDRVTLGPAGHETAWVAATGSGLSLDGDQFRVQSGSEFLTGRVLLPEEAVPSAPEPQVVGYYWKDQKLLRITPAQPSNTVEYLVVMRAGGGDAPLPETVLLRDDASAGLRIARPDGSIEVRFNRCGPVGGMALVTSRVKSQRYDLREAIEDTYCNWSADPRYQMWVSDPRLTFVVPPADRR